jgi:hypothetical protein
MTILKKVREAASLNEVKKNHRILFLLYINNACNRIGMSGCHQCKIHLFSSGKIIFGYAFERA